MDKSYVIGFICLVCGCVIGYIVHDCPDTTEPPKEICTSKRCCDSIYQACLRTLEGQDAYRPESIVEESNVDVLKQAYNNYRRGITTADSSGYSIDRELVSYVNYLMVMDPSIVGYRLYPAVGTDQNMKSIMIALTRNAGQNFYVEDATKFKGFKFNAESYLGYTGPCPTWCDQASRIIK